jgi:hypothetical protein
MNLDGTSASKGARTCCYHPFGSSRKDHRRPPSSSCYIDLYSWRIDRPCRSPRGTSQAVFSFASRPWVATLRIGCCASFHILFCWGRRCSVHLDFGSPIKTVRIPVVFKVSRLAASLEISIIPHLCTSQYRTSLHRRKHCGYLSCHNRDALNAVLREEVICFSDVHDSYI